MRILLYNLSFLCNKTVLGNLISSIDIKHHFKSLAICSILLTVHKKCIQFFLNYKTFVFLCQKSAFKLISKHKSD